MDGHPPDEQRAPRESSRPETESGQNDRPEGDDGSYRNGQQQRSSEVVEAGAAEPIFESPIFDSVPAPSPDDECITLSDDDFLPAADDAQPRPPETARCLQCGRFTPARLSRCQFCGSRIADAVRPVRPPGPGLPESLAWIFGIVAVQVAASVAVSLGLIVLFGLSIGLNELRQTLRTSQRVVELMSDQVVPLFGGVQAIMVPTAILAVWFRLGRQPRRRLPLEPVGAGHIVLTGLLLLFLIPFSSQLLIITTGVWNRLIESLPGLAELESQGSLRNVESLAERGSLPFLLIAIAIAPAVWEELVFRGLIGRGLVARLGLVWGVAVTAVLFSMIHLFPPQVIALFPLAVALHVAYLATRSIWVPIAIHLINNAVGVVMIKALQSHPQVAAQVENYTPPAELVIALGCQVIIVMWLMWRTRVQYVLPDGTVWDPGYVTTDVPPKELGARRERLRVGVRALIPVAAGAVLLALAFGSLAFRHHWAS